MSVAVLDGWSRARRVGVGLGIGKMWDREVLGTVMLAG